MEPHSIIIASDELCRDCQACALACSLFHEAECSLTRARLQVSKDMARYRFHITICQHCEEPACLDACPNGSIRMDESGIVTISDEECLRCGACLEACPYAAIFYDPRSDRYLKCDWCSGRVKGPLCVELCPVGALAVGPRAAIQEVDHGQ